MLTLLTSFEDSRPELSVTEIAEALGVHKSTASRLAAALERTGFLARSGKRYRLGVEIIRLGTLALRSSDLVATMQPAMEKLSQLTGETINLAVPGRTGRAERGGGAEHLHPELLGRLDRPPHHGRTRWPTARCCSPTAPSPRPRQPGALHRADDHHARRARARSWPAVRRDGYATAVAELEEGLVAVAAPVFDPAGGLRGRAVHLRARLPDAARHDSWIGSARLCASALTPRRQHR